MKTSNSILLLIFSLAWALGVFAQSATPAQISALEAQLTAATDPNEQARLCNELAFAWSKKDFDQALSYTDRALNFAHATQNTRETGKALNLRGDIYLRKNEIAAAEKSYTDALEWVRRNPDPELEGRSLHNLGKLAQTRGDLSIARSWYERAFALRDSIGDMQGLSSTTLNLGALYNSTGDLEKSNRYYEKALVLKTAAGDRPGLANVQLNLASNYLLLSQLDLARQLALAANEINESLGNISGLANGCEKLGSCCVKMGEPRPAIEYFSKAKSYFTELGDEQRAAGMWNNIGQAYTLLTELDKAQEAFLAALPYAESHDSKKLKFTLYMGLAHVEAYQQRPNQELEWYEKALPCAENDFEKANLLESKASAYIQLGQYEKGLNTAQQCIQIARRCGDAEHEEIARKHCAVALKNLDRLPDALTAIREAIHLGRKRGSDFYLASERIIESQVLGMLGENKKAALDAALQALALAEKKGLQFEILHAHQQLAEAYRDLGETDKALDALKSAHTLQDSLFSLDKIRAITSREKDFGFEQERQARQLEQTRKDAQTALKTQRQRFIIGLLAALLACAGLVFYFWRIRQRAREAARLAETRLRLSRDLHDDLGSALSSIALSSQVAADISEPAKMRDTLAQISTEAREATGKVRDLLWTLHPDSDAMEDLLARMRQFALPLLEAQQIDVRFDTGEGLSGIQLGMEARRHFFLFFKEAVNNLAKYAAASQAHIGVRLDGSRLLLTISDNGRGFDPSAIQQGHGLANMQARAEALGGALHVETAPGKGANLTLSFPI